MNKKEKIVGKINLTKKDLTDIHNAFCYMNHVKSDLSSIVKPEFIERLEKQIEFIKEYFNPILDAEDAREDDDMENLRKIQKENKFKSIWSNSEVSAEDMVKSCFLKFNSIEYYGEEIKINKSNKPKTWLDMWKLCNQLILRSGHEDHIFIESVVVEEGKARLITGS